jgi:hypothetical protein
MDRQANLTSSAGPILPALFAEEFGYQVELLDVQVLGLLSLILPPVSGRTHLYNVFVDAGVLLLVPSSEMHAWRALHQIFHLESC